MLSIPILYELKNISNFKWEFLQIRGSLFIKKYDDKLELYCLMDCCKNKFFVLPTFLKTFVRQDEESKKKRD